MHKSLQKNELLLELNIKVEKPTSEVQIKSSKKVNREVAENIVHATYKWPTCDLLMTTFVKVCHSHWCVFFTEK